MSKTWYSAVVCRRMILSVSEMNCLIAFGEMSLTNELRKIVPSPGHFESRQIGAIDNQVQVDLFE
jgi:hypothetical protein